MKILIKKKITRIIHKPLYYKVFAICLFLLIQTAIFADTDNYGNDSSGNGTINAASNTFTITQNNEPYIAIKSPNGGESLLIEMEYDIEWTSSDVDKVEILYSTDGGYSWETIEQNIDASAGSYSWTVPRVISTNCLIRITDMTNMTIKDSSDTFSIISNPHVIYPSASDIKWFIGEEYEIIWSGFYAKKVMIKFYF